MDDIYDPTFLCTYKQIDDDDLYRIQFLQAFKMKNWNDKELQGKMDKLYDLVGYHFMKIFIKLKQSKSCLSHILLFLGQDPSPVDLFQTLFCADLFQETHLCISDILRNGTFRQDNYDMLEKTIFI